VICQHKALSSVRLVFGNCSFYRYELVKTDCTE
jgi:hypothetical protein